MSEQEAGRERLQRSLLRLGRASAPPSRRGPSRAAEAVTVSRQPWSPQPEPEPEPRPSPEIEALDARLSDLAAGIMERFDAIDYLLAEQDLDDELEEEEEAGAPVLQLAATILERLDAIEQRLADIQRPVRPIPASREVFGEWVRLRKWEEMPFGDFLKLRRAGSV